MTQVTCCSDEHPLVLLRDTMFCAVGNRVRFVTISQGMRAVLQQF